MPESDTAWITPDVAQKVAERHGTPTHALSLDRLEANYRGIERAFFEAGLDMTVLYSVKTNYMPIVVDYLRSLGCGADVVSGPELALVLKLDFKRDLIVFNGPHKTDDELREAVEAGVTINVDGIDEARRLGDVAESLRCQPKVGLRVNPAVPVYLGEDPTFNLQAAANAEQSKFGFTIDDGAAEEVVAAIGFGEGPLDLSGLHCHLGSQITDEQAFVAALDKVLGFAAKLRERHPIQSINIGGGFGVGGIRRERRGPLRQLMALCQRDVLTDQKDGMNISEVARRISEAARRHQVADLRFYCEPGRAIVSDAMCMIARVASVKHSGGLDWLVLDAGLNLFPTIAMAESHKIVPLSRNGGVVKPYRVGGPLCYEADVLAATRDFPSDMAVGDLVSIEDSGAYTVSRSTNFIRPRAPVVAVAGDQMELCWRREAFDDIFAFHVSTSQHFGNRIYE